jgi:trimeric autotransporter adhesin
MKQLLTLGFLLIIRVSLFAQNVGIGNTNPQAALDLQGDIRFRSATLTLPSGLNNDVDLITQKSSIYMFAGGALAGAQITGFTGGVDGRMITIFNNSTVGGIQLYDAGFSVSPSAAANKILTGTGSNAVIFSNGSATLRYDGAKAKWIIMSSNLVDGLNANASWYTNGNTGTTALNFIGTSDAQDLRFKVDNTAFGFFNKTQNNLALGENALDLNTTGNTNVALGTWVLKNNTIGLGNTSTGVYSLVDNTIGSNNTANGILSLRFNTSGDDNTAIGKSALQANTSGFSNTAIGSNSLSANTTGNFNNAMGLSLYSNTSGDYNNALGTFALADNTTGNNNIAIGTNSLNRNNTGYSNVAIGSHALYYNYVRNNLVAIGDSALYNNGNGTLGTDEAKFNTAVGSKSLFANTVGSNNTANGFEALFSNTIGYSNIAMGSKALFSNTTGAENAALGHSALYNNTIGLENTAFGTSSLYSNIGGDKNTAVGNYALSDNNYGYENTAIGYRALRKNTNGYENTSLGIFALAENITGIRNVAVGSYAGIDISQPFISNTVTIGYGSKTNVDGRALLGNTLTTQCGGYKGWTTYVSDGRFKKNVKEDVGGLDFIKALRPVTYTIDIKKLNQFIYKDKAAEYEKGLEELVTEKANYVETGFIAQEVEAAAKKIGFNFDGVKVPKDTSNSNYGISYASFVVPLVKAVQEQQVIIENQNKLIADLAKRLDILEQKNK